MCKKETITKQLEASAFQETIPFCYLCYRKAPTGRFEKYRLKIIKMEKTES